MVREIPGYMADDCTLFDKKLDALCHDAFQHISKMLDNQKATRELIALAGEIGPMLIAIAEERVRVESLMEVRAEASDPEAVRDADEKLLNPRTGEPLAEYNLNTRRYSDQEPS